MRIRGRRRAARQGIGPCRRSWTPAFQFRLERIPISESVTYDCRVVRIVSVRWGPKGGRHGIPESELLGLDETGPAQTYLLAETNGPARRPEFVVAIVGVNRASGRCPVRVLLLVV